MKNTNEVIEEFNEIVNMTASELEKWLKSDDSQSAGWPKDENKEGDGESVGHDSGRNIVEILSSNPKKDPKKYTEDQVKHMRKVVSYCKRHLAQEEKSNAEKSDEEVKKTKSYASLKNWGHDPLKKRNQNSKEAGTNGKDRKPDDSKEQDDEKKADEDDDREDDDDDKEAGDKRKRTNGQSSAHKTRKTRSSGDVSKGKSGEDEEDKEDSGEGEDDGEEEIEEQNNGAEDAENSTDEKDESKSTGKNKKSKESNGSAKGPKEGDTVSWSWGNGHPEGKVLDVKSKKTSITTKRGNEVSRDGTKDDPAVVLDTGNSKAIKLDHELD